jgi:xylulokinase
VVYALRDGVEIMRGLGVPFEQIRATGGGGRSVLWRQMQADIYGAEVVTLQADQGPAYGAALLAGVGTGFFESVTAAVDQCVAVAGRTAPDTAVQPRYDEVYSIYRGLYAPLRESMHQLAALA